MKAFIIAFFAVLFAVASFGTVVALEETPTDETPVIGLPTETPVTPDPLPTETPVTPDPTEIPVEPTEPPVVIIVTPTPAPTEVPTEEPPVTEAPVETETPVATEVPVTATPDETPFTAIEDIYNCEDVGVSLSFDDAFTSVENGDPYNLDADGDGVPCEEENVTDTVDTIAEEITEDDADEVFTVSELPSTGHGPSNPTNTTPFAVFAVLVLIGGAIVRGAVSRI